MGNKNSAANRNAFSTTQPRVTAEVDSDGDIEYLLADFRNLSWTDAFKNLIEVCKAHYPYTAHRGLDWEALYTEYLPAVTRASETNNLGSYYVALRDFAVRLRDGHCDVDYDSSDDDEDGDFSPTTREDADVGGGYGAVFARIADGHGTINRRRSLETLVSRTPEP